MRRRSFVFALAASAGLVRAQTPAHRHPFSGAERWARVFDDLGRDHWQKPQEVIAALGLAPDASVADIGAGTGYFSARLAQALPKGRVYAVDIEPDMVRYLRERAEREKLPNVEVVLAQPEDPKLPAKVDRVLIVDTYHHIEEREKYFARLIGMLKPGGEVVIIDFTKESPVGPPVATRIAAQQVTAEMQRAGYALVKTHDFLPHQYFLVFRPR